MPKISAQVHNGAHVPCYCPSHRLCLCKQGFGVKSPPSRTVLQGLQDAQGPVNHVRKVAAIVPEHYARLEKLDEEKLDEATPAGSSTDTPAENARCEGFLAACQTWLELKDGQKNSIVITSPTDDTKELVNEDILLPASGAAIPSHTWSVMQSACKYGLADLSSCEKPAHWPRCTGFGPRPSTLRKEEPAPNPSPVRVLAPRQCQ